MTEPPESVVHGPLRDVGTGPAMGKEEFTPYQELRLRFDYDFRTQPPPVSARLTSPPFLAHGYSWVVRCSPSGSTPQLLSTAVSLELSLFEPAPLPAKLRGTFETSCAEIHASTRILHQDQLRTEKAWSLKSFMTQEQARNAAQSCEGGRLTIVLRLAISKAHAKPALFRPQLKSWSQDLLNEILDTGVPVTRGATFVVGTERSTIHLPVKLCEQRLPQLNAFLQEEGETKTQQDPIVIRGLIRDMTMASFRVFLSIALTGITASTIKAIEEHPYNLLDLADRFGFVELKIYMESHLALYHMVDVVSALYLLSIAHARNCALLKEYCMDYLNGPLIFPEAATSKQWLDVVQAAPDLHRDMYQRLGNTQSNVKSPPKPLSELYRALERGNLDLDGTRTDLEDRLKKMCLSM